MINLYKRKNNGKPGKSFLIVQEIDYNILLCLSVISKLPDFETIILSKIEKKYRQKDKEFQCISFLKFQSIGDSSRITEIFNFLPRSVILNLIKEINKYSDKYTKINKKRIKEFEDKKFLFEHKYLDSIVLRKTIKQCYNNILLIRDSIVKSHLNYSCKLLMERRIGEENPNNLYPDAFETIVLTLDKYDTSRSKVPFNKLLGFYLKNRKNNIIKRSNFNLNGTIVPLEDNYDEELEERRETVMDLVENSILKLPKDQFKAISVKHNIMYPMEVI